MSYVKLNPFCLVSGLVKICLWNSFITTILKSLEEFKGVKYKIFSALPRRCHSKTLHLNYLDYIAFWPLSYDLTFFYTEANVKREKYKLHFHYKKVSDRSFQNRK